ncbi:hypothetical protein [Spirosoma flavus]
MLRSYSCDVMQKSMIGIRKATPADADAIWTIIKAVIASGNTYVFPHIRPAKNC